MALIPKVTPAGRHPSQGLFKLINAARPLGGHTDEREESGEPTKNAARDLLGGGRKTGLGTVRR
jgi:hypothetical protein